MVHGTRVHALGGKDMIKKYLSTGAFLQMTIFAITINASMRGIFSMKMNTQYRSALLETKLF